MDKDFGAYELRDRIGKGGMAWVYLAHQKNLDRPVALKILYPHLAEDEKLVARFQLEARSAAQMRHENVCQVYDFGRHGNDFFIAMEYVEGKNLREWIDTKGAPPIEIALLMLRDICRGLEHAHRRSIIHRDIKPSNVMFTPEGVIKLMDFGLARRAEDTTGITMVGAMLGTPAYMSPEQARGEKLERATTDIFSLGIVCYELLGGTRPFQGDTSSIARAIQYSEPRPLDALDPLVPSNVEAMIRGMLEKDATKRVQTVTEVRQAFDTAIDQMGVAQQRELLAEYAADPGKVGGALRARRLAGHHESARAARASGDETALLREYRCIAFLDSGDQVARQYVREHDVPWPGSPADEVLDSTRILDDVGRTVMMTPAPKFPAPVAPPVPDLDATQLAPPSIPPVSRVPSAPVPDYEATQFAPPPPAAENLEATERQPVFTPPPPAPKPAAVVPPPAPAPKPDPKREPPPPPPAPKPKPAPKPQPAPKVETPKPPPPVKPKPGPRAGGGIPVGAWIGIGLAIVVGVVLAVWQPWKQRQPVVPPPVESQTSEQATPVTPEPSPAAPLAGRLIVMTTPAGALVSVENGPSRPSPARFDSLEPRNYTVRVMRDSFRTALRVVPIAAGRETTLAVRLKPAKEALKHLALLVVQTVPADASVRLDGAPAHSAPARFPDVADGEHTLEVSRDGYEPRTLSLVARAAAESTLNVTLVPVRKLTGGRTVTVKGPPKDALISLDGGPVSQLGTRFEKVPRGTHRLRVTLAGFKDGEVPFAFSGQRDTTITLKLEAVSIAGPTATVILWSRPAGDFFVEHIAKGTALDSTHVTIPANREQLVTIKSGEPWLSGTAQLNVRLKPGEVRYVGSDFTLDAAALSIETPGHPGAEVLIDGRHTGRFTPATLYVGSSQHRVHVVLDGWRTLEGEQTIRFKAKQPRSINFTLQR